MKLRAKRRLAGKHSSTYRKMRKYAIRFIIDSIIRDITRARDELWVVNNSRVSADALAQHMLSNTFQWEIDRLYK